MSMSIASSTAASVAPQVRSRSVSLRIGSFGITYATDQVLWAESSTAAGMAATATASQQAGPVTPPAAISTQEQSRQAGAQASSQTDTTATQATRRFSSDLEAARQQAMFLRNAANGEGAEAGLSSTSRVQAAGGAAAETGEEGGTDIGSGSSGARSTAGQNLPGNAATARVRQAIGAYLACAASFGQGACMLRAVA